jgi:hypothetical protein
VLLIALVCLTVLSYAAGWILGIPLLVPVLNTAASYPFMVAALKRGDLKLAVVRMLVWALTMAVCATLISYLRPWASGDVFLRGAAYRAEMFAWIMTGRGPESTPSAFVPQHAVHAAVFTALALATGGAVAMAMGATLMNYMGHYVGSLAAASSHPLPTIVVAWHPWSIIRIISYVTLGVVLSAPLLSRVMRFRVDWREARILAAWACAGLVADVVLKALIAPAWQRLLLRVVGW